MEFLQTLDGGIAGPVVMGTWPLGGDHFEYTDQQSAMRTIHEALDQGIRAFDTAPVYGQGRAMERLSQGLLSYFRQTGQAVQRESVYLIDKGGLDFTTGRGVYFYSKDRTGHVHINLNQDDLIRQCEQSLSRLGTDYLDLYLIHWPHRKMDLERLVETAGILKERGMVRELGVSNFSASQIGAWNAIAKKKKVHRTDNENAGDVPFLRVDQERFSPVARKALHGNLPHTIKNRIHFMAYSPLAQGLLTGSFARGPLERFSGRIKNGKIHPATLRQQIENIWKQIDDELPGAKNNSAAVVLSWVLSTPGVGSAAVGFRRPEQVNSLLRYMDFSLNEAQYRRIADLFAPLVYEGK